MTYTGTTINDSPVIAGTAAAELENAEFTAVKFDADGAITKATEAGEAALGLLPAEEGNKTAGETVTVQIKDIGYWKTGAAVAAGDLLATTAEGKAAKATSGQFALAIALEAAAAADAVIKVQLVKAGYVA